MRNRLRAAISAVTTLWDSPPPGVEAPVQRLADPNLTCARLVAVRWGEPLSDAVLCIEGDESRTRYVWSGAMECGREGRYLLLVAERERSDPRAAQRVVPVERARRLLRDGEEVPPAAKSGPAVVLTRKRAQKRKPLRQSA